MSDDFISRKALLELANQEGAYGYVDAEQIAKQPTVGGWIPVSDKLPAEVEPVNVTWINREPEPYYVEIKDTPFTATAVYCKGKWWWYSATCEDYLREYLQSPGSSLCSPTITIAFLIQWFKTTPQTPVWERNR